VTATQSAGTCANPGKRRVAVVRPDGSRTRAAAKADKGPQTMCIKTVADVMVRHPKLCPEDSTAGDVRQLFADDHVHAILIVSGTRLLTVIDRADLGPHTADSAPAARLGRLSGRVTAPATPAAAAQQQMLAASRRRLAVIGPDGTLLGLLCLKSSSTAFCSDENVRQRQRERLQQPVT